MCMTLGISRYLKKELAWITHKRLLVISNIQVETGSSGSSRSDPVYKISVSGMNCIGSHALIIVSGAH